MSKFEELRYLEIITTEGKVIFRRKAIQLAKDYDYLIFNLPWYMKLMPGKWAKKIREEVKK